MTIDFLAIGHVTRDLTPNGPRLGGTVSFAAVTALRLGRRPAILTRGFADGLLARADNGQGEALMGGPDGPLDGVPIHMLPSPVSTTFTNVYRNGRRVQVIATIANPIAPADLPPAWAKAPIVLLGPVARELPDDWAAVFPHARLGVTPQGWMRQWDAQGHVYSSPWHDNAAFLDRADAIILSREDVGGDKHAIAELADRARLLVVTDGWRGATVYCRGDKHHLPPRPANEVDPTGAGDVFATAFLIRLTETADPFAAARFANATASMSVEAPGMAAIPYRTQVEAWLQTHP